MQLIIRASPGLQFVSMFHAVRLLCFPCEHFTSKNVLFAPGGGHALHQGAYQTKQMRLSTLRAPLSLPLTPSLHRRALQKFFSASRGRVACGWSHWHAPSFVCAAVRVTHKFSVWLRTQRNRSKSRSPFYSKPAECISGSASPSIKSTELFSRRAEKELYFWKPLVYAAIKVGHCSASVSPMAVSSASILETLFNKPRKRCF